MFLPLSPSPQHFDIETRDERRGISIRDAGRRKKTFVSPVEVVENSEGRGGERCAFPLFFLDATNIPTVSIVWLPTRRRWIRRHKLEQRILLPTRRTCRQKKKKRKKEKELSLHEEWKKILSSRITAAYYLLPTLLRFPEFFPGREESILLNRIFL